MDILLLFPPISLKERYGKRIGTVKGIVPPLGLAFLASFVRQKDFSVKVIDAVADDFTNEKLIEYQYCPNVEIMKDYNTLEIVAFNATMTFIDLKSAFLRSHTSVAKRKEMAYYEFRQNNFYSTYGVSTRV